MFTVTDVTNRLQKKGVHLDVGGASNPAKYYTICISKLIGCLYSDSLYRLSECIAWKSLKSVVQDWIVLGMLPSDSKQIEMYKEYYKGNYATALRLWFEDSYVFVPDIIPGYRLNVSESMDAVDYLRYLPLPVLEELTTRVLFYTNDMAEMCEYRATYNLANWLNTMSRYGFLKFEPYTLRTEDSYEFAVKYNRVLKFENKQFKLMAGDSVYAYSGILPAWDELCKFGEELAVFIYYTAALSVCINCSDFQSPRNYVLLDSYIKKLTGTKIDAKYVQDKVITATCCGVPLVGGYRICKNNAWDYVRWDYAETIQIELPGTLCTMSITCDLSHVQDKAEIAKLNCKARMWYNDDPTVFQLLTGVLALFGILYNDKVVRALNSDDTMPAVNPHAYLDVDKLLLEEQK